MSHHWLSACVRASSAHKPKPTIEVALRDDAGCPKYVAIPPPPSPISLPELCCTKFFLSVTGMHAGNRHACSTDEASSCQFLVLMYLRNSCLFCSLALLSVPLRLSLSHPCSPPLSCAGHSYLRRAPCGRHRRGLLRSFSLLSPLY